MEDDPIIDRQPTAHGIKVATPLTCDCGSVIQAHQPAYTRNGTIAVCSKCRDDRPGWRLMTDDERELLIDERIVTADELGRRERPIDCAGINAAIDRVAPAEPTRKPGRRKAGVKVAPATAADFERIECERMKKEVRIDTPTHEARSVVLGPKPIESNQETNMGRKWTDDQREKFLASMAARRSAAASARREQIIAANSGVKKSKRMPLQRGLSLKEALVTRQSAKSADRESMPLGSILKAIDAIKRIPYSERGLVVTLIRAATDDELAQVVELASIDM